MVNNNSRNNKDGKKRKKGWMNASRQAQVEKPKTNSSANTLSVRKTLSTSLVVVIAIASSVFFNKSTAFIDSDPIAQIAPVTKNSEQASCGLVMAPSSIEDAGWGVFAMKSMERNSPTTYGDIVIHVPDIPSKYANGIGLMIRTYMWLGSAVSGQFEGKQVFTNIGGIGMLANGHRTKLNLMPSRPAMDNARLHRAQYPGAGAISQYHNFSFYAARDISPGEELLIDYGTGWGNRIPDKDLEAKRDTQWLAENGMCIDNLKPQLSTNAEAGRGAFANRDLNEGSIIAPVPVIPIARSAMKMMRMEPSETSGKNEMQDKKAQLMQNYCYGNKKSSMLLFPYGPFVNYINHNSQSPNAKLQWSESSSLHSGREWLEWPVEKVMAMSHSGLLLELVALRDIEAGEEIYIDYGQEWEDAWNKHVSNWKVTPELFDYGHPNSVASLYKVVPTIVEQEQSSDFPKNIMTACYYDYAAQKALGQDFPIKWARGKGTFQPFSLRPCVVVAHQQGTDGKVLYTVQIKNYSNEANPDNKVPDGVEANVTHVPRGAIRFVDKTYESDQHLPSAFRHEIGLSDELFPKPWMDLA